MSLQSPPRCLVSMTHRPGSTSERYPVARCSIARKSTSVKSRWIIRFSRCGVSSRSHSHHDGQFTYHILGANTSPGHRVSLHSLEATLFPKSNLLSAPFQEEFLISTVPTPSTPPPRAGAGSRCFSDRSARPREKPALPGPHSPRAAGAAWDRASGWCSW